MGKNQIEIILVTRAALPHAITRTNINNIRNVAKSQKCIIILNSLKMKINK